MNTKLLALTAAGAFFAATTAGMAQSVNGSMNSNSGASATAPGVQMQQKGSVKGTTGASGYAPGQTKSTTGADVKSNTGVKAGGANVNTGVDAGANVKTK